MQIEDLGQEIKHMTVADIAIRTGKTERYVKTYMTRNSLHCLDYNGAARKAASLQRIEQEKRVSKTEKPIPVRTVLPAYDAIAANKKESNSLFTAVSLIYGAIWLGLSIWGFKVNGGAFFLFWILMSFGLFMASLMTWGSLSDSAEKKSIEKMPESERNSYLRIKAAEREALNKMRENSMAMERYGAINANLICPHCQTKGKVRSKSVEEITKTKVVPVIGNNIKSRRRVTQIHCDNCDITWNA